jgi:predicted dehydrogenase
VSARSFEDIITDSEVGGLVLAVPAPMHANLAIQAMNAGKHVYVEKPLAMNELEARQMIDTSKDKNVSLMVGHLLQYHPIFIALRALVESGELGDLSYIYSNRLSFGKVRSEEDVVWSFAPHDISMILSLTGVSPHLVRAEAASILQPGIADTATIHMEFLSGLKAHVSTSWLHPFKEQKLVVVGGSAMAVFDDTKPWREKLALYRHAIDFSGGLINMNKSEVEYLDIAQSEPLRDECQHFIDVISKGVHPLTGGEEGLSVLKVLSAASLSQIQNDVVKVDNL